MTKRCVGPCGRNLPWCEFHAAARWEDGTMRRPQSRCKACHNEANAAQKRRARIETPEKARREDRRKYRAVRADPDRWAEALRRQREAHERRRRAAGVPPRPLRIVPSEPEPLSSAAFGAWLEGLKAEHGLTTSGVADRVGLRDKAVYRYVTGESATVELATVEAALIADGNSTLDDLYPFAPASPLTEAA